MYNKTTVISNGSDLVGFSTSTNAIFAQLPSALKNKTYNVNDLPGINLGIIDDCVVEKSASDYIIGATKNELIKLVDRFVLSVKNQLNSKELLSTGQLFKKSDFFTKITKSGRFYGYVITPQGKKGVQVKVTAIGFYPDESITGLPVYVYKASEVDAVQTISYNHTTAKNLEWQDVDVTIDEQSYIGYFQDDAPDLYTDEVYFNEEVNKFASIIPCTFESGQLNGTDRPNNIALNVQQYHPGFNLKVNVKCDITDILIGNLDMFAQPLQYALAVRILSDALATTELNSTSMASKFREQWEQLRIKYNGELMGGVLENGTVVKGMIDRLALDFSALDPVCLPPKEELVIGGRML